MDILCNNEIDSIKLISVKLKKNINLNDFKKAKNIFILESKNKSININYDSIDNFCSSLKSSNTITKKKINNKISNIEGEISKIDENTKILKIEIPPLIYEFDILKKYLIYLNISLGNVYDINKKLPNLYHTYISYDDYIFTNRTKFKLQLLEKNPKTIELKHDFDKTSYTTINDLSKNGILKPVTTYEVAKSQGLMVIDKNAFNINDKVINVQDYFTFGNGIKFNLLEKINFFDKNSNGHNIEGFIKYLYLPKLKSDNYNYVAVYFWLPYYDNILFPAWRGNRGYLYFVPDDEDEKKKIKFKGDDAKIQDYADTIFNNGIFSNWALIPKNFTLRTFQKYILQKRPNISDDTFNYLNTFFQEVNKIPGYFQPFKEGENFLDVNLYSSETLLFILQVGITHVNLKIKINNLIKFFRTFIPDFDKIISDSETHIYPALIETGKSLFINFVNDLNLPVFFNSLFSVVMVNYFMKIFTIPTNIKDMDYNQLITISNSTVDNTYMRSSKGQWDAFYYIIMKLGLVICNVNLNLGTNEKNKYLYDFRKMIIQFRYQPGTTDLSDMNQWNCYNRSDKMGREIKGDLIRTLIEKYNQPFVHSKLGSYGTLGDYLNMILIENYDLIGDKPYDNKFSWHPEISKKFKDWVTTPFIDTNTNSWMYDISTDLANEASISLQKEILYLVIDFKFNYAFKYDSGKPIYFSDVLHKMVLYNELHNIMPLFFEVSPYDPIYALNVSQKDFHNYIITLTNSGDENLEDNGEQKIYNMMIKTPTPIKPSVTQANLNFLGKAIKEVYLDIKSKFN